MTFKTILAASVCAAALLAQSEANKGTISGTVSDPNGGVVPRATVIVTNVDTGLERRTATADSGRYTLSAIDPGTYDLRVEEAAFAATVKNVEVSVGADLRVNITVTLQARPIEVDLAASFISIADTHNNQVIPRVAIQDLPINGRRFQDFATLTPGVLALPETRGQLSFVGQRGVNSNIMVDGVDYNDPFLGGIRGGERSVFAFTIPQSAVQEFQAVTAGYSPEYGRSTGGVLNAITRSGSNTPHGELFYQTRNKSLSKTTPLDQRYSDNVHQFGGAAGGPLERDKLFVFAAAEQQLARYPRQVWFSALDNLGGITPDIAPAYNYLRSLETGYSQTNDATAVLGRLDYQFQDSSRLTTRYLYSRNLARNVIASATSLNPQTSSALSANGDERDEIQSMAGQLTTVLQPLIINDVHFQFSREARKRRANSTEPFVQAGVIGTFGADPMLPSDDDNYRFQAAEAVSFITGNHSLRFGVDYSYIGASRVFASNPFGAFLVSGSDVRTVLRTLSGAEGGAGNRFDHPSVIYRRQIGGPDFSATAQQLAFFAQNNWRIARTFSLNFGLRWEGQFNPSPALDNEFLLTNVRDFEFPLGGIDPTVIRDQLDQWAPRAGFAWDVSGTGRTVVRGSAGLYYGQTPLLLYAAPLTNFGTPPGDVMLQLTSGGGRTIYQQFAGGGFDLNASPLGALPVLSATDVWQRVARQPNPFIGARVSATSGERFRNPRAAQSSFTIAQHLASGFVVDYTLNHVNTVHLQRNIDFNVPVPTIRPGDLSERPFFGLRSGTPRPNRNLAWVMVRDSSARSNYLGHTFRSQYRSGPLQFALHYTLSYTKSDDDTERVLTEIAYQNPFDFSRDYNWSSLDSRHQVGGWAVYQAPMGFEFTGVLRYRSGLPLDAYSGEDSYELATPNLTTRPLERPGLPMLRNAFRNRDFKTVDARIMKSFHLTEAARLQFSAELFNLFNFNNVAFISSAVMPNNPAFIYGPGILPNGQTAPMDPRFMRLRRADGRFDPGTTAQVGTPLQAQFGLRLIF
jgi:hypothetical protein